MYTKLHKIHNSAKCLKLCRTSVYGSAVCVYNLTAFDIVFDGPFKYQRDSQSAWIRVPNVTPIAVGSRHVLS